MMIKANSLLYAVYICLIISIFCGAIIYLSTLYNQLNTFFKTQEELYIDNYSATNFGLGNNFILDDELIPHQNGIESNIVIKSHGAIDVALIQTFKEMDTVSSAFFLGERLINETALYLSNFDKSITYIGNVELIGDIFIPFSFLEMQYQSNKINNLNQIGKINSSTKELPEISEKFIKKIKKTVYDTKKIKQEQFEMNVKYPNSFVNETIEVICGKSISSLQLNGNYILTSKDTLTIHNDSFLNDVVIYAPKVIIEKGYKGNLQIFATNEVVIKENVILEYPSIVSVYNKTNSNKKIEINENSKVYGLVFISGNDILNIDKSILEINKNVEIYGTIYSFGILDLKGNVFGSVYANKLQHSTANKMFVNSLIDVKINTNKKDNQWLEIPIFKSSKNYEYGLLKKTF